MYVYIKTESRLWTVGYYEPDGKFHPESDHNSTDEAAKRVAYLNGKTGGFTEKELLDIRKYFASIKDKPVTINTNLEIE